MSALVLLALLGAIALPFSGSPIYRAPEDGGSGGGDEDDEDKETQEDEDEEEEGVQDEDEEEEEVQDEDEEDEKTPKARAATPSQLQSALPKAGKSELFDYASAGLAVSQAKAMHKSRIRADKKSPKRPGGKGVKRSEAEPIPVATASIMGGSKPLHEFDRVVARQIHETGASEAEARRAVIRAQPKLYQEYRQSFVGGGTGGNVTMLGARTIAGV